MYFQIKEIILWPKNRTFEPRHLKFLLGQVNVISGASRTGKSAIIPIIDYCLGSATCSIPVKTIRDSCEWFGIVVETRAGQKLFARREPGEQKSSADMFVTEATQVLAPRVIEAKNTNLDTAKNMLDEMAGLTNLDFDVEAFGNWFKGRPSFRDMAAFTFQPQNIVANPDVLFYKADTYEHQEKLRTIFPYVLNAISPELMAKQHELEGLKKEFRRKENELTAITQVSERWLAEIQSQVSEARELGLIGHESSSTSKREDLIDALARVVEAYHDTIHVTPESIDGAVNELVGLLDEEGTVSGQLAVLSIRLTEMATLREASKKYEGALQVQRDRLQISEWLWDKHVTGQKCPLCESPLVKATDQISKLRESLRALEKTSGSFENVPAAFDREFERVRADVKICVDKLESIQIRKTALEKSSDEAKHRQYESLKASRFIGNVEQSLKTHTRIGQGGDLAVELQGMKEHIGELEAEIAAEHVPTRIKRAIALINHNASQILPSLDCERPNEPVTLSIKDLSISVSGRDREDYLREMGSGSNWLAYHVAISLGLQQFFLDSKNSPVPSFIAYDQPSQVYFPRRLAVRDSPSQNLDPQIDDEDILAVRKTFDALAATAIKSDGNLQIIVLDHAARNVWGTIHGIHLVEEWREGRKLVPEEWLSANQM